MRALSRTAILVLLSALVAFSGSGAHTSQPRSGSSQVEPLTMTVRPEDFAIVITASGELQSAETLAIAVPPVPVNRLRIATVVPDGRHMQKGDVIVEFDPTEIDREALEHRSSLKAAEQKLQKGEVAVDIEKSDIRKDRRVAEMELERLNQFLPKDAQIYSQREIVEAQINKEYTEQRIVHADARLELKGKIYTLDEAILMLERQQAANKIGQAEKALAALRLLAPASGIVVYNNPGYFAGEARLMPGQTVWSGMTLFNLVNPETMEAKCFVLEKDAGELQVGQPVTLTLDPHPGRSFAGNVKSIDKLARPIDRESPVKYFQTIVSLHKTERGVMNPGVKLKAKIKAADLKSVIVLPRSAVLRKDSSTVAYVRRDGNRFVPVPVVLGSGDVIRVVVKEGLARGDVVAIHPPDVSVDLTGKKTEKP